VNALESGDKTDWFFFKREVLGHEANSIYRIVVLEVRPPEP
jgi:hypothetical protein